MGEDTPTVRLGSFIWTVGREVDKAYALEATHPDSINSALTLRAKRQLLAIKEFGAVVMTKLDDWRTATVPEIDQAVTATLGEDDIWIHSVETQAEVLERMVEHFDYNEKTSIQIMVIKKEQARGEQDYAYLVVYPPQSGLREMEVSFPTALCHILDAEALLNDSNSAEVAGVNYEIGLHKIKSMSDADLTKVVTATGRTLFDRAIQTGLSVVDRVKKRRGQHIDPISARTNKKYALQYALAIHKGAGEVKNERITLPPVKR